MHCMCGIVHCCHPPLLQAVAVLMRVILAAGAAPAQVALVSVPLVPKPSSEGLRPVGVFSALYRVMGSIGSMVKEGVCTLMGVSSGI